MNMPPRHLLAGLVVTAAAVLGAACSAPAPGDTASPAAASTPAPSADNLLSSLQTTVSVKELMHGLFDPASDFIFLGAGSEVTKDGIREWKPETDEDWEKVRLGAMVMAEGSQLLRVHRSWAPAGDVNNSEGPDAPELSPDQIEAKVNQDPVLWDAKVQALENVGREVLQIVDKKDAVGLFNAGDDLDTACEDCHLAVLVSEPAAVPRPDRPQARGALRQPDEREAVALTAAHRACRAASLRMRARRTPARINCRSIAACPIRWYVRSSTTGSAAGPVGQNPGNA